MQKEKFLSVSRFAFVNWAKNYNGMPIIMAIFCVPVEKQKENRVATPSVSLIDEFAAH